MKVGLLGEVLERDPARRTLSIKMPDGNVVLICNMPSVWVETLEKAGTDLLGTPVVLELYDREN